MHIRSLLSLILVVSTTAFAQDSTQSATAGLLTPLKNMDHLCFALLAGLVISYKCKKNWYYGLAALGLGAGLAFGFNAAYVPGTLLISALALVALMCVLWWPSIFERGSAAILVIGGFFQGAMERARLGPETLVDPWIFSASALLVSMIVMVGFGVPMARLSRKSQSAYDGLEHLTVAVAAGTALVFIVWGLL